MNPVLVEVMRSGVVESMHRGALAIVNADGAELVAMGDITRPIFPRSAIKMLQALPLVASGAADELGLTDEELALACASHGGEPRHTASAASMLRKAGLDSTALECGAHWPSIETAARALAREGREPSALHNNCSGKHAGFICVGCLMARQRESDPRAFVRGYVQPEHPVMREVTATLQAVTDFDLGAATIAIDGCSVPTFAIPLRNLALAFARLGTGAGLAEEHSRAAMRLRMAVAKTPFMVAGSGRFDTRVMQRLGVRVLCKTGAEGVYCAALPDQALGVAIKIDDGNNARAAEVVMAAVIEALVPLGEDERRFMQGFSDHTLQNWNGIDVGALRAGVGLRETVATWS